MSDHPACQPVSGEFNVLKVAVEKLDLKYQAKLHICLRMPFTREVNVQGPLRDSKPEAIRDGMELGKRYVCEGEAGAKTVALRLKKKRWTMQEAKGADENLLSEFVLPGLQGTQGLQPIVLEKRIPTGEGWTRYTDDMLVHSHSQVYFVQSGERAGQYLRRTADQQDWADVVDPHASEEHPIALRTASASCVRRGGKLDRAVLLNDITKIARLACKIPLAFVDRPACACALFQGLRSSESSQWCAENFHKKLLPRLANKIHLHETSELEEILCNTLRELDSELLKSPHAFSGCSALIALVLGNRLIVAGVGQVRALILPELGKPELLLAGDGDPSSSSELNRIRSAGGIVCSGLVQAQADDLDEVSRILSARNAFDVLMVGLDGPFEDKDVRSSYRKLALRVHPDKQSAEGSDVEEYKRAFARLEACKEELEAMLGEDSASCHEICRILRSEVHTRAGAASLLGVDALDACAQAAEKSSKELIKGIVSMQRLSSDHQQATAICQEAVETVTRLCMAESLPRQEALLREAIDTGRAMGVRDLRAPRPIVLMDLRTASWDIPRRKRFRVALLCGPSARLSDERLTSTTLGHSRHPKASALRWCLDALEGSPVAASSSSVCFFLGSTQEDEPQAKRPRATSAGPEGCVRVRHILFSHQQLKQQDLMARREGAARTAQEAEEAALRALDALQKDPKRGAMGSEDQFPRMCRELSDCQSAAQAGKLSGDLGWIGRGQQEAVLEEVVFSLAVNELSDIVSSMRGIHIVQRLA